MGDVTKAKRCGEGEEEGEFNEQEEREESGQLFALALNSFFWEESSQMIKEGSLVSTAD